MNSSKQPLAALQDFADAYLHEDYAVEHGSARSALEEFLRVANHAEVQALAEDCRSFLFADRSAPEASPLPQAWLDLSGAGWAPENDADLWKLFGFLVLRPSSRSSS